MSAAAHRTVPALSAHDRPLRAATGRGASPDIRAEAARQLRTSLWLVFVLAIGFAAALASRPDVPTPPRGIKLQQPVAQLDRPVPRLASADLLSATRLR